MLKIKTDEFLAHPVQTSLFLADFALLLFLPLIRPPILLSMLLVGGLVYLAMFFGAKLALAGQFPPITLADNSGDKAA